MSSPATLISNVKLCSSVPGTLIPIFLHKPGLDIGLPWLPPQFGLWPHVRASSWNYNRTPCNCPESRTNKGTKFKPLSGNAAESLTTNPPFGSSSLDVGGNQMINLSGIECGVQIEILAAAVELRAQSGWVLLPNLNSRAKENKNRWCPESKQSYCGLSCCER